MTFTVRQLEQPSESEKDAAVVALSNAFLKDEFTLVCIGRDMSLMDQYFRSIVTAGLLAGEVYVAEESGKGTIGVSVWFPPGRLMFDSPDQVEQGLVPLFSKLPADLLEWWQKEFLPQYEKFSAEALGEGVKKASWHLQEIGTVPEERCKGVGGTLIACVREKKGSTKMCLEAANPDNLKFYDEAGFSTKGETKFSNKHGSFPMWSLLSRE